MGQRLPPYAELLKIDMLHDGRMRLPFHVDVVGRPGFLHGGVIGGLLEMVAYSSLMEILVEPDTRLKQINLTVNYMRGGVARDTYADASIKRLGRRIANVEARAWQEDPSRPIATAEVNFLISKSRSQPL